LIKIVKKMLHASCFPFNNQIGLATGPAIPHESAGPIWGTTHFFGGRLSGITVTAGGK
jgi:hypothetical protein